MISSGADGDGVRKSLEKRTHAKAGKTASENLRKKFANVRKMLLTFTNAFDIMRSVKDTNQPTAEGRATMGDKIAYIRVSTQHQNTERQHHAMPDGITKIFEEKASAKDTERPEFQKMLEYVREGDTVYFESFSRISRSLPDLLETLDYLTKKGVAFVSLKEQIDTSGATGKLIISVLGALNAYEREINAERREYGYRKALEEGKVGRPAAEITPERDEIFERWEAGKMTAVQAMKQTGLTKTTFYKLAKLRKQGD